VKVVDHPRRDEPAEAIEVWLTGSSHRGLSEPVEPGVGTDRIDCSFVG